jgi:hypothetical protein
VSEWQTYGLDEYAAMAVYVGILILIYKWRKRRGDIF